MTHEYDDIIHLPHPVSKHYPPMPMSERAAQFSSFAAVANPTEITNLTNDVNWDEADDMFTSAIHDDTKKSI